MMIRVPIPRDCSPGNSWIPASLDQHLVDIDNNVYGTVLSEAADAEEVARAFLSRGWRVRRAADAEYEVENTWATLLVVPMSPLNLSGVVEPARVQDLVSAFGEAGYRVQIELYNAEGQLVGVHGP